MRIARRVVTVWAGACLPSAGTMAASPVQQSFQVSADVVTGCSVATSGSSQWGSIDLGTVSGIASGTVSASLVSSGGAGLQIDCTPGTTVNVTADAGSNANGGLRRLTLAGDGSRTIAYRLYVNGTTEWTTQSIPVVFVGGTSRVGLPVSATATLPGSQKAGAYSDTVRVTLAW